METRLGWCAECGVKSIETTSLAGTQPAWLLANKGWALSLPGLPQEDSCSPCWGPQLRLVRRKRLAFSLPSFMIPRPGVGLCAAFPSACVRVIGDPLPDRLQEGDGG